MQINNKLKSFIRTSMANSGNEIVYAPNSAGSGQYFNVYFTNNVIALSSNQDKSRFTCYAYIKYINKN